MKNIKRILLAASLVLSVVGCSQNNDGAEIASLQNKIREIEKENEELKNLNGETGIVAEEPETAYDDSFLRGFCDLIEVDDPTPLLKKQVAEKQYIDYYIRLINSIKQDVSSCEYQKSMLYDHPFDIAEYKTDKGFLYVQAAYSPQFKMRRFIPLMFEDALEMSVHQVPTQDGEQLTTWTIQRKGGTPKKGAIFLRTPYMVYGSVIAQSYLALYFDKMLVIQANRGSHNSTGDFKWLDPKNIEDSRDSLDWIVQQPRSNGRVMAFGVSYDGYDALASAATNHPALKSVVACSAPANAATDSFTSGQFVENGIFSYVTTDRRNESLDDVQNYWEFIKLDASSEGRSRMDDILLGFDSEEWNQTSGAIDNRNHQYWKDRQLMNELLTAKMPIAHVAGLVRDQDGRDTLLAFNHINEKSPYRHQNYLVLHKDGHGCGDFFSSLPLARKLIELTDSEGTFDPQSEQRLAQYTKAKDGYELADTYEELPIEFQKLSLESSLLLEDYALQRSKDESLYAQNLVFEIQQDMTVNGAPTMELALKANVPEVPLHVHFFFVDPQGGAIEGAYGWRTAAITSKVDEVENVRLTFPLINAEIPKGSQLMIEFSTRNPRVFLRAPLSRNLLTVPDGTIGTVEIISTENHLSSLTLPVEISKPSAPASDDTETSEVSEVEIAEN